MSYREGEVRYWEYPPRPGRRVHIWYDIGESYFKGKGCARDYKQAISWYLYAAYWGEPKSIYRLSECCKRGLGIPEDPVARCEFYERVAGYGSAAAAHCLACCYASGTGVEKNEQKAYDLLVQAFGGGYEEANLALAEAYFYGRGTTVNYRMAANCYACISKITNKYLRNFMAAESYAGIDSYYAFYVFRTYKACVNLLREDINSLLRKMQ